MGRLGTALERRSTDGGRGPVAERLVAAVEHRLTRAIERRVGGAASNRQPGRVEQRVVAALERRLTRRSPPPPADTRVWARVTRTLVRRPRGGTLASGPNKTLRALVVSLLARFGVKTLVRLARLFSRGLFSRPMRRLLFLLARRAIRAGPTGQLGLLGLLGTGLLLAYRALTRRLAGMPEAQQTAIKFGARGLRRLLALVLRLTARLLRALGPLLRRELGRAVRAYKERGSRPSGA